MPDADCAIRAQGYRYVGGLVFSVSVVPAPGVAFGVQGYECRDLCLCLPFVPGIGVRVLTGLRALCRVGAVPLHPVPRSRCVGRLPQDVGRVCGAWMFWARFRLADNQDRGWGMR
jgi:hypothetical protein